MVGKMGRGTERGGLGTEEVCWGSGEAKGPEGATPRLFAQAILTSHLDTEGTAGAPWACPRLAGVEPCMSRVCSLDTEDAARSLSLEFQALSLLHRPPIVTPENKCASPRQFTAQHHRFPRGHTEWARGFLWGKELDWGLWRERGRCQLGLAPTRHPGLAGSTHQPG